MHDVCSPSDKQFLAGIFYILNYGAKNAPGQEEKAKFFKFFCILKRRFFVSRQKRGCSGWNDVCSSMPDFFSGKAGNRRNTLCLSRFSNEARGKIWHRDVRGVPFSASPKPKAHFANFLQGAPFNDSYLLFPLYQIFWSLGAFAPIG
jgi:hypothetical protein